MSTDASITRTHPAGSGGASPRGRLRLLDVVLPALLVAYAALYLSWLVFRWGPEDLQLAINDGAFIPLGALVTATLARSAWVAPSRRSRAAWGFAAASLAAFLAGDALWFVQEIMMGVEVPTPSVADIGYLAYYPLLVAGLLALPRERAENRLRALLDIAIVTT